MGKEGRERKGGWGRKGRWRREGRWGREERMRMGREGEKERWVARKKRGNEKMSGNEVKQEEAYCSHIPPLLPHITRKKTEQCMPM